MHKKLFLFIVLFVCSIACVEAGVRSLYRSEHKTDFSSEESSSESYRRRNFKYFDNVEERNSLYFAPNAETFVRDAEYFLPYTKGYTALGFFLVPTFTYINRDGKVKFSAGIHLMGIAGDHKKIRGISPIVTIQYSPIPNIRIVGGTLDRQTNVNHGLGEPMFDYDRKFYAPKEDGLQVFAYTKHWATEMWCNWEDFIVVDSPWQEKFTFGWANKIHANWGKNHNQKLEIPLNLMMNHRGGQIDAVKDTCIETLANFSAGLSYELELGSKRPHTISLSFPFYGFSNRSDESHIHTHFKQGWGLYPALGYRSSALGKHWTHHSWSAGLGYWYGDGFISGRGSYLFQSRSYFDESFERRYRHMLTATASYDLNRIFSFLAQAYYDLDESKMDYAVTIALRFDKNFKIHTWEKRHR